MIAEGTPGRAEGVGRRRRRCTSRLRDPEQRPEAAAGAARATLGADVQRERRPGGADRAGVDGHARAGAPAPSPRSPDAGIDVDDFSLGQPSLDEVFLALTGHAGRRAGETADDVEEEATHDHHRDHHPDRDRRRRAGARRTSSHAATGRRGPARCRRR